MLASRSIVAAPQLLRTSALRKLPFFLTSASHRSTSFTTTTTTTPSRASFSSTPPTKMSSSQFLDAVVNRRSIYNLTSDSPIPDSRIVEIAETTIKQVPSSFDSRSTRLVVLLNDEHRQFWDFVLEVLQPHLTTDEARAATGARIGGFRNGHGTILFFEDPAPIKDFQTKFKQYADRFPQWSEHSNAMHQFTLWTALEAEGLGANLQHYNPLIDNKAKEHWGLDLEWSLKAQLVFGGLGEGARDNLKERTHPDLEKKLKIFGQK